MENYNAGIDVDKEYPYIFPIRGELYLKQGQIELANADLNEILKQDTVIDPGSLLLLLAIVVRQQTKLQLSLKYG